MSPATSSDRPSGPYRKPKADIYTALLAIALVALLIAIILLYLELDMYQWQHDRGPTVSAARHTTVVATRDEGPGTRNQAPGADN